MSRDITEIPPIAADRRVAYGGDPSQFFDLWLPAAPIRAAVVMIHGGFWRARYDLAHASHLCSALSKAGLAVANLEYRRVGNPGGGWPGTFHDIVSAVSAACREFGAQMRIVVIGHSAGGHLALRFAAGKSDTAGIVALAPVADLRVAYELHLSNDAVVEFLRGTPDNAGDAYDDACPSKHDPLVPCRLVHGSNDEDVPLRLSKEYIAAVGDAKANLVVLEDIGHMDLIDPESRAWPAVLEAVNCLLSEDAS